VLISFVVISVLSLSFNFVFQNYKEKFKFKISEYGNIYLQNIDQKEEKLVFSDEDCDIKNGYEGLCNTTKCNLQTLEENIQPCNATVSNHRTCNSISSSHGEGRGKVVVRFKNFLITATTLANKPKYNF